jgi:hypothetical protein
VVEKPPQALFAVGEPHALHRGAREAAEAERGQLLGLGLLALGQRVLLGVVLRPYRSFAAGSAGKAAFNETDFQAEALYMRNVHFLRMERLSETAAITPRRRVVRVPKRRNPAQDGE